MRLAGQIKGGFYPAPPEALAVLCEHLQPPPGRFSMLDPCCGEGEALAYLATRLFCHKDDCHAIELSDTRAEKAKSKLANGRVLAPAAFEGCLISPNSLGLLYLNPPFDAELGGGNRVEYNFLVRATRLLCTKGVLAFVLPEYVLDDDDDMLAHLRANYRALSRVPFPADVRQYDEVIVLGVKRSAAVASDHWEDWCEPGIYEIPASRPPARFEKTLLTASEIAALLANSPLRRAILSVPDSDEVPRPPLPLGVGHTALLVASGQLDGVVRPVDEPPHVVRGTVRKKQYLARTETKDLGEDKGSSTTCIYSERISPIVRIATVAGQILTLGEEEADA